MVTAEDGAKCAPFWGGWAGGAHRPLSRPLLRAEPGRPRGVGEGEGPPHPKPKALPVETVERETGSP